ncbi:MAG: C13 family peptidase, partial [bacterium]
MRNCLLVLLSILLAAPVLALPVSNPDQAVQIVEQSLLPQGKDNVVIQIWGPVSAGTEIRGTRELALIAPTDGYAIYIDDYPTANLFHPVRYAFVSSATGEVIAVNAASPPLNFEDYEQVSTAIGDILMAAENRRAPLPQSDPPTRSDRWAVLGNGGYNSGNNHVRYWNDLSNIYITLVSVYGFADDHIIVLCSDGTDPAVDQSNGQNSNPDLDGDGDADIMYSCVLSNVDLVFGQLATQLTVDDKLFVFWTDHGNTNGGWNTLFNLWNMEEMTDAHFAGLLDGLPQCEIICTFEPCYSGGFLDNVAVAPGPRIASSACTHDQVSWAMPPDYVYDTYVFHWTAAVKGEDAYGVPVNADYNGDGLVTMDEAYRYAEENDQSNEDPQYAEYPIGIGAGISLWPSTSGPFLVVANKEFEEIVGNGNGSPDPGETMAMTLTLNNVGNGEATNILGTLSTTDPYLTITQNSATYPDLGHFEQGQGSPAYELIISSACPQGQTVSCNLHITADSAYTNDVVVSFLVGDPLYDPVGPDAYGYYAYDILDYPEAPVYNWMEIAPAAGGSGVELTALTGQDDRSALVTL